MKQKRLIGEVQRFIKENDARRILVAVSGGIDSMVLLNIIGRIWDSNDFAVVNVDHRLRSTSAEETRFVRDYCQEKGFQFFSTKWEVPDSDVGLEAAARTFRYDFFEKIMQEHNFDTLLTAHHANDLAENILMKMIRSGNVYEIASLKKKRPFGDRQLLRPLLGFSKKEIERFGVSHQIKHVQDESNFENITMRNRLRNDIFPSLQKENGQLLEHFDLFDRQLQSLIDIATQRFLTIEDEMNIETTEGRLTGQLEPIQSLNFDQQTLFWGSLFTQKLVDLSISNKQIQQVIAVVTGDKPNSAVDLENGWKFNRSYQNFVVARDEGSKKFNFEVVLDREYKINGRKFKISESDAENATFAVNEFPKQIALRTRENSDRLAISHSDHQKLSKRLINQKIPEKKRANLPILLFDNVIVWVEKIYNISDYLKHGKFFFKIEFDEVKK